MDVEQILANSLIWTTGELSVLHSSDYTQETLNFKLGAFSKPALSVCQIKFVKMIM